MDLDLLNMEEYVPKPKPNQNTEEEKSEKHESSVSSNDLFNIWNLLIGGVLIYITLWIQFYFWNLWFRILVNV